MINIQHQLPKIKIILTMEILKQDEPIHMINKTLTEWIIVQIIIQIRE